MPRLSDWDIPRPKFTDDQIRIPRPAVRSISAKHTKWAECPLCQMPQLMVDTRRNFQLVECNWCKITAKVRVTNYGRIKVEGIFQ